MRLALVFPPLVHPTYVPLGISSLVALLRQRVPMVDVSAYDLNIRAWHRTSAAVEGPCFLTLGRLPAERLFEPSLYQTFLGRWDALARVLTQGQNEARHYVETGELSPTLQSLLEDLLTPVVADRSQAVGFSLMYLHQLSYSLALARYLRERAPEVSILLGGAALSALDVPALVRACPYLDAVLPGEGEEALVQFAQGVPCASLPGAVSTHGTPVAPLPPVSPIAMDGLPTPAFDVWDLGQYANPSPVLPLVLSRDCRWRRCRFCVHNRSFDGYREKPVEALVDDLAHCMQRYGARHFYLADQYVPAERLASLSEAILRRGLDLHFHVMARPTGAYTPDCLARAAAAGCRWISWGVETGSQRLLDLVHKGTQRNTILRVLRDSHAAGIANLAMMIFGLPTSTPEDLDQTLDFLDASQATVQAFTSSRFVLFEGTDFARWSEALGLVVTGRDKLLRIGDQTVHGTRLDYRVRASDNHLLPPPADLEIVRWYQRRRWYGERPLQELLNSEHLLLYCGVSHTQHQPHTPSRPQQAA
jgi:anaerobic magnesium-protoporphyrin IX monomethyl ester cyclase